MIQSDLVNSAYIEGAYGRELTKVCRSLCKSLRRNGWLSAYVMADLTIASYCMAKICRTNGLRCKRFCDVT